MTIIQVIAKKYLLKDVVMLILLQIALLAFLGISCKQGYVFNKLLHALLYNTKLSQVNAKAVHLIVQAVIQALFAKLARLATNSPMR